MGSEFVRTTVAKLRLEELERVYSDRLFEICALDEAEEVDGLTEGVHVLYLGVMTSFQMAYPGQTRTLRDEARRLIEGDEEKSTVLDEEEVAAEIMTEGEVERQLGEEENVTEVEQLEEEEVAAEISEHTENTDRLDNNDNWRSGKEQEMKSVGENVTEVEPDEEAERQMAEEEQKNDGTGEEDEEEIVGKGARIKVKETLLKNWRSGKRGIG